MSQTSQALASAHSHRVYKEDLQGARSVQRALRWMAARIILMQPSAPLLVPTEAWAAVRHPGQEETSLQMFWECHRLKLWTSSGKFRQPVEAVVHRTTSFSLPRRGRRPRPRLPRLLRRHGRPRDLRGRH